MDSYLNTLPEDPGLRKKRLPPGQGPPRKSRAIKMRLLTRDQLDGRTHARRHFDRIARGVAEDLGGEDQLSTIQKCLVEAFAGVALHVYDINSRMILGEKVDITIHSTAVSTMCRAASRIGLHRIPREIKVPTIDEIAKELDAEDAAKRDDEKS
jgi:hypothetical protein